MMCHNRQNQKQGSFKLSFKVLITPMKPQKLINGINSYCFWCSLKVCFTCGWLGHKQIKLERHLKMLCIIGLICTWLKWPAILNGDLPFKMATRLLKMACNKTTPLSYTIMFHEWKERRWVLYWFIYTSIIFIIQLYIKLQWKYMELTLK